MNLSDPLNVILGISERTDQNNERLINEFNPTSEQLALNRRTTIQRPQVRTRRARDFHCRKCRYRLEAKYFNKTQQIIFKFSKRTPYVRCKECIGN